MRCTQQQPVASTRTEVEVDQRGNKHSHLYFGIAAAAADAKHSFAEQHET